jgi:non-specific serine/threonine protein kinase
VLGLTQAELAQRLGVAPNTLARWERGVLQPSHVHLILRRLGRLERNDARRATEVTPPTSRSHNGQPGNLPAELSSFVGREQELSDIRRLLGTTRVLTLTGAGGVGKTRLAVRAAERVGSEYAHGVWYVDLAPLATGALLPNVVAAAIGVREQPRRTIVDALIRRLAARRVLLVLDNAEHLIRACADLLVVLLRGCPLLRVLTTSREPLGIDGETVWRVPSMGLPAPAARPEDLAGSGAIQLFVERARAAVPGFQIDSSNGPKIAALCRRLDGIALAIELAAARLRVLTVDEVSLRLDRALDVLVDVGRTGRGRQRTMRGAVGWSYQMLTTRQRQLFDRLSVFAGGCTLPAAEEVCSGGGIDARKVLDTVTELVDRSLVVVDLHMSEAPV